MGCLSSKEAAAKYTTREESAHNTAIDGPPDFGVDEHFQVKTLLGEGGSGQTWLCFDRRKRKTVAIKFIKRPIPRIVLPMLMHEIKIQAELGDGHVNLVGAKGVVLTDSHLGIVMEYAAGGNLTAFVTEKWATSEERNGLFCTEDEARYFFRQYINAVEFLHANHVAHRDLKLDNIVLDGHDPPRIKVCDFGFAKNWTSEAMMFTQIGTPVYMAPQLISAKSSQTGYDAIKADIWACGVLLFVMLHGMFPYDHPEHPDPNSSEAHVEVWMQQIKCAWRDCPNIGDAANKLSLDCQDLLDKMFDQNEARRITIDRIKKHRWFRKSLPPHLQAALDDLAAQQARIVEMEATAAGQPGVNHEEHKSKRDQELEELIARAGTEASLTEQEPVRMVEFSRCDPLLAKAPATKSVAAVAAVAASPTNAPAAAAVGLDAVKQSILEVQQQEKQEQQQQPASSNGQIPAHDGESGADTRTAAAAAASILQRSSDGHCSQEVTLEVAAVKAVSTSPS